MHAIRGRLAEGWGATDQADNSRPPRKADATNAGWLRELSASHGNSANLAAGTFYQAALAISDRLAEAAPQRRMATRAGYEPQRRKSPLCIH